MVEGIHADRTIRQNVPFRRTGRQGARRQFLFCQVSDHLPDADGRRSKLAKEFGPQGVVFLSITCDPANDTPVALALYAQEFAADSDQWLFLTGDLPYLKRVGAEMYFLPVDVGTHSELFVVVDKWGQIRKRFSWKDPQDVADLKKFLTELLAETDRPSVK